MRLNPNDIRKATFARVMRGLDAEEVQAFLDTLAEQSDERERELSSAKAKIADLELQLQNYRSMEDGLRDTLLAVQNSTQETREQARREAELILKQAEVDASLLHKESRDQLSALQSDIVNLESQRTSFVIRLRALLKGQIDLLEVLAAVQLEDGKPPIASHDQKPDRRADEGEPQKRNSHLIESGDSPDENR